MLAVIKRKHNSHHSLRDMTLFAKKFHEEEALKLGIIDGIVSDLGPVVQKAKEVSKYSRNRENFKDLKMEQNKVVIEACFDKQYTISQLGPVDSSRLRPRL